MTDIEKGLWRQEWMNQAGDAYCTLIIDNKQRAFLQLFHEEKEFEQGNNLEDEYPVDFFAYLSTLNRKFPLKSI